MTAPIFTREGDALVPTEQAIGPWDPGQLHGGAPAALIADAIQRLAPEMQLTRLTCDFLGAVPAEPLFVEAEIVKPGGRLQLAQATVVSGGRTRVRASAVLLRKAQIDVPPAGRWDAPLPAGAPGDPGHTPPPHDTPGFHRTGMTIRFANGTAFEKVGSAQTWFALERDLVAGEPLAPVARVAAAADFGNGIGSVLDWDAWLFVNCDLTVSLLRDPATAWVLLDATTRIDPAGIGIATSTLYDERGPIGLAHQTLFVAPR
jgi:hypothetical protein